MQAGICTSDQSIRRRRTPAIGDRSRRIRCRRRGMSTGFGPPHPYAAQQLASELKSPPRTAGYRLVKSLSFSAAPICLRHVLDIVPSAAASSNRCDVTYAPSARHTSRNFLDGCVARGDVAVFSRFCRRCGCRVRDCGGETQRDNRRRMAEKALCMCGGRPHPPFGSKKEESRIGRPEHVAPLVLAKFSHCAKINRFAPMMGSESFGLVM